MESDDSLNVSPILKAKFVELAESKKKKQKKQPLEELAQAILIYDTFPDTSVRDLVNHYESGYGALTLEKWEFIFKKLQFSKEFDDLLAVHKSQTMLDPTATAVGQVNFRGLLSDVDVGATGNNSFKTETQQELELNSEAFQQLEACNVKLEAELNLTMDYNETLLYEMTRLEQELELISKAFQQLQARKVELEAELNLTMDRNETLLHEMTRLEQELELISKAFQRLQACKVELEAELNSTKLHNETLSHQMAERAQASDNEIQRLEQQCKQEIQRLEQQCKQLCEQKDQEYEAVVEVIIEMNENLEQLKRDFEEQQHLLSTILEENHQLWLLVVGEDNALDGNEVFEDALDHF